MEIEYGLKQEEDSKLFIFYIPIILLILKIIVIVLIIIFLVKKIREKWYSWKMIF